MQIDKIISFNTGRQYSDKGQRIAAAIHNGVVIMVDIDRGIDYALFGASLERNSIMNAYDDPELHCSVGAMPELFNDNYKLMSKFIKELEDHALLASPGCILPK
jgi:hypothetical protein